VETEGVEVEVVPEAEEEEVSLFGLNTTARGPSASTLGRTNVSSSTHHVPEVLTVNFGSTNNAISP
jgi:hypothetical protein